MSRYVLLGLALLGLLALGLASLARSAAQPTTAPPTEAISKRPMLVLTKEHGGATLEQAQMRELGGRRFVVGKEAKGSPYTREMYGGGTAWIPLDAVTQLVELPDANPGK